jgi:hypothetical protein
MAGSPLSDSTTATPAGAGKRKDGIILFEEEHGAIARPTLERDTYSARFAITPRHCDAMLHANWLNQIGSWQVRGHEGSSGRVAEMAEYPRGESRGPFQGCGGSIRCGGFRGAVSVKFRRQSGARLDILYPCQLSFNITASDFSSTPTKAPRASRSVFM